MPHPKSHEDLESELTEAKKVIKIGATYTHFKDPTHVYKVLGLAHQEATDKVCVIYQTLYGKNLTFIRDLSSWTDMPVVNGKKVQRFKLVKTQ